MRKLLTALSLLMLCVPSFSQEVEEIHVYDAISFVHALRSNRVIVVENNIDFENELENLAQYNPDEIKVYREYDKGDLKELVKMSNHPYLTMENDGMQLNVREVHNLTIRGPKGTMPLLRIQPRYAYVLRFTDSDNIRIENLVMGHTEGGYCEGGVLAFEDCRDVTINHCDMYGCGMEGINFTRSMELKCTNSIIRDCTYQIMDINTSRDVLFDNCIFTRNKEFTQIILRGSVNILFRNCQILNNVGSLLAVSACENVKMEKCNISHDFGHLGDIEDVVLDDCSIWNSFGAKIVVDE